MRNTAVDTFEKRLSFIICFVEHFLYNGGLVFWVGEVVAVNQVFVVGQEVFFASSKLFIGAFEHWVFLNFIFDFVFEVTISHHGRLCEIKLLGVTI